MTPSAPGTQTSSVDKAVDLLRAFGEDATVGVGVSELARRTGQSKSTAFRLLAMLERKGVVERAGSLYRLGSFLEELNEPSRSPEIDLVREVFTPFLAHVYEHTRQTVHLATLVADEVVYLNKLHGPRPLPTPSRIGGRLPAHATGVGKALLAFDPDAAARVMGRELPAWTPSTITTSETLAQELAGIRRRRVGYDREELRLGLHCVAAPIVLTDGTAPAAMSVSGPVAPSYDAQGRRLPAFRPAEHAAPLRRICAEAALAYERALAAHRP